MQFMKKHLGTLLGLVVVVLRSHHVERWFNGLPDTPRPPLKDPKNLRFHFIFHFHCHLTLYDCVRFVLNSVEAESFTLSTAERIVAAI